MRNNNSPLVLLLVAIAMIFLIGNAKACDEIYLKIGTGYKFDEQHFFNYEGKTYEFIDQSKYSARFETGIECGLWTFGVAHHSQWATGAPFNKTGEYYKTEFFIDRKFSWRIK